MTEPNTIARALLLASVALFAGAAAHAQDAPSAPAEAPTAASDGEVATPLRTTRSDSGEIVVSAPGYVPIGALTANKSSIPLIQTPQSISVVTRDQIDLLNYVDAQQAVRYTAGVFGENYGPDPRFDFFTVRGFTPKQYIDGLQAPITTTIFSTGVDLYAFQSLDLLKGPASVLYGNAPPGGIYNETSRRASSTFGGEVHARYGEDDFRQLAATVTGPAADWLDVRVTAMVRDRDDIVDHLRARRMLIAPTATFKLSDTTRFTPLFYYQYDRVLGGNGGFLPVYGTLLDNPNGRIKRSTNLDDPNDYYERRQWGAGWDFQQKLFDGVSFNSNVKWSHYKDTTPLGVYDSGGFVNTTDPTSADYFRTVTQSNFTYREQVASFAADNRLDEKFATGPIRHHALVGVDYRNVENDADYGFFYGSGVLDVYDPVYTTVAPNAGYPTRYNHQRLKQTGVYGQDQLQFGKLYVTLGGRYDWFRSRYLTPFTAVTDPATVNHQKADKFTWRAGANYVFDSGIAPYVSYSRSFEPQIGVDSVTGSAYKPSQGKQIEGGVKYDARGLPSWVKLFATAAAFDIRQTNVVSSLASVSPVFGTASGLVEVYGGELELVARIHDRLSINASYSYTHSEVKKGQPAVGGVPDPQVGAPLPTTPKNKASLFADYTIPDGVLAGFGGGGGLRYTSDSAGSLPGAFNPIVYYGQAATLFDATLHYDVPGWRFQVNASNLADKVYVARCAGPASCFYGAGRQVIGTVTRKF